MKIFLRSMVAAAITSVCVAAQAKVYTDENGEKMECHKVKVAVKKEWGAGDAAGGVVGHQIGGGRCYDVVTAAGAVGGAIVGHEVGQKADTQYEYRERCHHVK